MSATRRDRSPGGSRAAPLHTTGDPSRSRERRSRRPERACRSAAATALPPGGWRRPGRASLLGDEAQVGAPLLDPDASDLMERLQENGEVARLVKEIKDWVEQIHAHGCVCKGVEQGLIDFPCVLGAEVVFLCWQLGEANVGHWHRIEDGFAGRRPLLEIEKTDPGGNTSYH